MFGDGGYDTKNCREAIRDIGAIDLIPPRGNSRPSNLERRTQALLEIKGLGGDLIAREIWGKLTGYLKRPLVETAFSFLKRLFGERFYSKKNGNSKG